MPVLTPEFTYNEIVQNFSGFKGGSVCWNQTFIYTGVSNSYYGIGRILFLSLSDLDKSVHTSLATSLEKEIVTFKNGAKLIAAFWVEHFLGGYPYGQIEGDAVYISARIKYNGSYWDPSGQGSHDFPFLYTHGYRNIQSEIEQNNLSEWCPYNQAKTYGCKIIINTNYQYGLEQTIPGTTKAAYFEVSFMRPCISSQNMAGQQSFTHILEGGLYFNYQETGDPDTWVSNGQYLWSGYQYARDIGFNDIVRCDNFNSFLSALNTDVAPNKPPVTINDLIERGIPGEDPTQEYDPSEPGGGDGTPDPNSDPIPFPDLPTGGALSSGAIKAFKVTPQIMAGVFQKLWNSSIFDISTFQKLTNSPIDNIISLQCLPIAPTEGAVQDIKLGNFDTEQDAHIITQEYYTIDCGSLTIAKYWGSALDYQPYTRVQIFLPFIGIRELDTDDVMGKTIHVKYNYSIFDGNLTAQIMCGQSVLYKFNGNVRETIPVTAQVSDALQRAFGGIASGVALGLAGGATAAVAGVAISSAVNVAMAKTQVQRSGDLSGSTGLLDDFRPYLIIHRPIQSLADNFRTFKGYPSNISAVLSSLNGYTEVEYIHLTGIDGATDTELTEIENLLKNGVLI